VLRLHDINLLLNYRRFAERWDVACSTYGVH